MTEKGKGRMWAMFFGWLLGYTVCGLYALSILFAGPGKSMDALIAVSVLFLFSVYCFWNSGDWR